MKTKGLNRSSEKTKKSIKIAFAELIKEKKELQKVTVTDLVTRADIHRGTFYLHYDSIYGVAEEFEEELLETLGIDTNTTITLSNVSKYIDRIFDYLKVNEEIYKMLLVSPEPQFFLTKLNKLINNIIYQMLIDISSVRKSKSLKFDVSFFTDGIISQVLKYFTENYEYSLDDISCYMKKYFKIFFIE